MSELPPDPSHIVRLEGFEEFGGTSRADMEIRHYAAEHGVCVVGIAMSGIMPPEPGVMTTYWLEVAAFRPKDAVALKLRFQGAIVYENDGRYSFRHRGLGWRGDPKGLVFYRPIRLKGSP